MQEAWAITDCDCALRSVTQLRSEFLELPIDLSGLFDVIQESNVIAGPDRRQVCSQDFSHGCFVALLFSVDHETIVSSQFCAFFESAAPFERSQQLLCRIFRFLNIRLIEGIYTKEPARTSRGKLPFKKLCTEIVDVGEFPIDDGMTSGSDHVQPGLCFIRNRTERNRDEHAIVAVNFRVAQRFAVYWKDSFPFFARAFSDQLFDPQP